MPITISHLYNNYSEAQAAINKLESAGVKHGDISVIASNADDWYRDGKFPDRDLDGRDDRAEAAGKGAGLGAGLGVVTAGILTGLGLITIPGVGPVAAGWLAFTLAGAAAGGAAGGVVGALTQARVGKDDADVFAENLRRGGAIVSTRVSDGDAPHLQEMLDSSAIRVADRAISKGGDARDV